MVLATFFCFVFLLFFGHPQLEHFSLKSETFAQNLCREKFPLSIHLPELNRLLDEGVHCVALERQLTAYGLLFTNINPCPL